MTHTSILSRLSLQRVAPHLVWLWASAVAFANPLTVDPVNPHYLLFRDKPVVLIGSSEHYGAVINQEFDYVRYLDTVQSQGLNITRVFSGQYHERKGSFGVPPRFGPDFEIVENTLAPEASRYVAPWPRSLTPGALDGGNRFDLSKWNVEYFQRLRDFLEQASRRGIVVELTLFSTYYVSMVGDRYWEVSPWNRHNNVNGIDDISGEKALTLKDSRLLAIQDAMVRKIVTELNDFDNVYYEICNEPYVDAVPLEWQAHIAQTVRDTEASLPRKHLILQEFVDLAAMSGPERGNFVAIVPQAREYGVETRLPRTQLLAFHDIGAVTISKSYPVGLPVGQNESVGIMSEAANRISAWRILLAGGAFYHGTDYSFTRGHEDGSFVVPSGGSGGGSAALRQQFGILNRFVNGLNFVRMKPTSGVIAAGVPEDAVALVLAEAGRCYAVYLSHGGGGSIADPGTAPHIVTLNMKLPQGRYVAKWLNTKSGAIEKEETVAARSKMVVLTSPEYSQDIALRIDSRTKK